jgi:hypothetical protein
MGLFGLTGFGSDISLLSVKIIKISLFFSRFFTESTIRFKENLGLKDL